MKILWVKSGGLVPLDHGGKIRSYQLARELARKHDVTLFTFCPEDQVSAHAELEQVFARVLCLPLRLPAPKSLADYAAYARNLFSGQPYSMAKYCRPWIARKLRQFLNSEPHDVMLCDFLLTAAVIPWDMPGPKVLFTHNIEAQIWQRHYQVSRNPIWKAVAWREYQAMRRLERRYIERAEYILTVSEADRDFFARFADPAKITVIPTGVDPDYFRPTLEAEQPNTIVFTGSMDWLANEDGILYFLDEVLPRIRKAVPDVSLCIVGRRPSSRLRERASREKGVHVTGTVADIRPYMARGSVYVVPLLVGGGTRIKIFEAMAMSKPIVSTSIGAEGLPVKHEENIILADQPEEFADQVVRLLGDPERRGALGRAARRLVERNYGWAAVTEKLEEVLARAAANSSKRLAGALEFSRSGETADARTR